MRRQACLLSIAVVASGALLSACGGDKGVAPRTEHLVTLTWAPNHESGVNRAGGGYQVAISGQPVIDVPYVSGPTAPTSVVARLWSGTYTVTVRAYAPLDAQGGGAGSLSAPSQPITVTVP